MGELVAVTSMGLRCALGDDPKAVAKAIAAGKSGVQSSAALSLLGSGEAGIVQGPDLRDVLLRRKDKKLMARPTQLALAAAADAMQGWEGPRDDMGLFLGVGREPPDSGDAEPALAAACKDGVLDEHLLAGEGRDRYPPLLPLKTLPNMALAHISINLGLHGENGIWTGDTGASLRALAAGIWAVREGRVSAALVGATDSLVDFGSARDRLRQESRLYAPGEGAAMLVLENLDSAWRSGRPIYGLLEPRPGDKANNPLPLSSSLGDCGASMGALAVVIACAAWSVGEVLVNPLSGNSLSHSRLLFSHVGNSRGAIELRSPGPC